MAADTTVSVGLRGSLPADTLLFIAVTVDVVDATILLGSIGSICKGTKSRQANKSLSLILMKFNHGKTSGHINQCLVVASHL